MNIDQVSMNQTKTYKYVVTSNGVINRNKTDIFIINVTRNANYIATEVNV